MKLVQAILVFCVVGSILGHEIKGAAKHLTTDPLWAKNCNGDPEQRLVDINNFLMTARLTEEGMKEVQEGIAWIKKHCLKVKKDKSSQEGELWAKDCHGDVASRIQEIEYLLATSLFAPGGSKEIEDGLEWLRKNCVVQAPQVILDAPEEMQPADRYDCNGNVIDRIEKLEEDLLAGRAIPTIVEEELAFLRETCQGECPENAQKAINDLDKSMRGKMFIPSVLAALNNKREFLVEICLAKENLRQCLLPHKAAKKIAELRNRLMTEKLSDEEWHKLAIQIALIEACLPKKKCPECDKLKKKLKELEQKKQRELSKVKSAHAASISKLQSLISRINTNTNTRIQSIQSKAQEFRQKIEEKIKEKCNDESKDR